MLVFDLVDYIWECGNKAGASAAAFIKKDIGSWDSNSAKVEFDNSIRCVVPQRINSAKEVKNISFFMRTSNVLKNASLNMINNAEKTIYKKKISIARPPEMINAQLKELEAADTEKYKFKLEGEILWIKTKNINCSV